MFQVGESARARARVREQKERGREPRSKRFYDTGRRRDITPRRFLRIGKAPELPPPTPFPPPCRPI